MLKWREQSTHMCYIAQSGLAAWLACGRRTEATVAIVLRRVTTRGGRQRKIDGGRGSTDGNLTLQLLQMLRSQAANETDNRASPVIHPFNS